jgi:hypothetical protein
MVGTTAAGTGTTAPIMVGTTAAVGTPVTVGPATTAPVGTPVTVGPQTTAPVGTPVTVGPATTAPVVTSKPVTTAKPATTAAPVGPLTPPVMCKKEAKSLRTMKKLKNVASATLCQEACQEQFMKGCVTFNYNRKKKTCQLMKLKYKKANGKVCTGRLAEKFSIFSPSFKNNKEAKSLAPLKKLKLSIFFNIKYDSENDWCQAKCQTKKGCVAFTMDSKKESCQLFKLVLKKKKGTKTGTPFKL